eukprot:CAMPEP_0194039956 /NCGR_PEP_ID=MMETSP0009_2-20130614/12023_1 /TAXON_ID=210454 /ORGANISM="Grammatophora oceanica, Strain CCMP 410" /LENGTH=263 /DNA_ID=CAMNT_0038682937 /DNA_START=57 /DNA_END=845 /DNA_ORIENTATION=-
MERDVNQGSAGAGFSFSVPYLYDGLRFGGIPPFGSCADNLTIDGTCSSLKLCVVGGGSTHAEFVLSKFPSSNVVLVSSTSDLSVGLVDGTCNAIGQESPAISETVIRLNGYDDGPYETGTNVYTKEPLAIVARDDDPFFADFVNWVLLGLLTAEEMGITQRDADSFPKVTAFAFGEDYHFMLSDAIRAVGNYGEMYARHLEDIIPRDGLNLLNSGADPIIIIILILIWLYLLITGWKSTQRRTGPNRWWNDGKNLGARISHLW